MKNIIISQPWGGLGDNLQFSTLPELYHNKGYNVYISSDNIFRNNEIYELVWKPNPYIKGIINPELGEVVGANKMHLWPDTNKNYYFINRIEIAHGFEPSNFYPKIYLKPNYNEKYKDTIIIDLSGSSQVFEFEKYKEFIDYFVPDIINSNKKIYITKFNNITISDIFNRVYDYLMSQVMNINFLTINSLFEYCDILNSCDKVIILNSGINSLVSAIKEDNLKPDVLCFNVWTNFSQEQIKGYYNYKNINYYQSKI